MDEIWKRLQRVKRLNLRSSEGVGSADVRIEAAPSQLIFHERGSWETGIAFSNIYRWTRQEDGLSLEHMRQGTSVLLFYFIHGSSSPHLCGKDCYTASLAVNAAGILLSWQVKGPKKDAWGEYLYTE